MTVESAPSTIESIDSGAFVEESGTPPPPGLARLVPGQPTEPLALRRMVPGESASPEDSKATGQTVSPTPPRRTPSPALSKFI